MYGLGCLFDGPAVYGLKHVPSMVGVCRMCLPCLQRCVHDSRIVGTRSRTEGGRRPCAVTWPGVASTVARA